MLRVLLLMTLMLVGGMAGCAMLHDWKKIPPPGGCDRCHQVPIAADWQVVLTRAAVPQPGERYPWQAPESAVAGSDRQGQVVEEEACFRCHRGPDLLHTDYQGRYHRLP